MAIKVKTSGKVLMIILVLGAIFAGKVLWWDKRPQEAKVSQEIGRVALPDAPEASLAGNASVFQRRYTHYLESNGVEFTIPIDVCERWSTDYKGFTV
jgi:hypothetical protein